MRTYYYRRKRTRFPVGEDENTRMPTTAICHGIKSLELLIIVRTVFVSERLSERHRNRIRINTLNEWPARLLFFRKISESTAQFFYQYSYQYWLSIEYYSMALIVQACMHKQYTAVVRLNVVCLRFSNSNYVLVCAGGLRILLIESKFND